VGAQDEVVDLCSELIRIDTSNFGDPDKGPGERAAAEWVAEKLSDVGIDGEIYESAPGRASLVGRIEGADSSRPPLLVHGHLDVVPADAADWQVDPFAGEIRDDMLWGRGAVDMKDMDAMMLAVFRAMKTEGRKPPRDIVFAFLADEEAGGSFGAHWLVQNHADLFADCTEAVSEVGGFSLTISEKRRLYLIQTAEKGMAWMRLRAKGTAGHGSMTNTDNAVTRLAEAVARLGNHEFPLTMTDTVDRFLRELSEELGVHYDPADPEATVSKLGPLAKIVGATLRNTANPTMLDAGYKHNVIPQTATAMVDGRFLPGQSEEFERQLDAVLGDDVERDYVHHDIAVEAPFEGALVDAMTAALLAEDPGARVVPYCISGGTDAKSFSTLGMTCYGFSPLLLPPDLDFSALFHGVDERVPVEGLRFGARTLDRFLMSC
jgi:acetylornithine deacetylase/succinyl-diaminopimelate desuccinylase-like protein